MGLACVEGSSRRKVGFASAWPGSYLACLASKASERDCVQLDGASYLEMEALIDLGLGREVPCHRRGLDSASS